MKPIEVKTILYTAPPQGKKYSLLTVEILCPYFVWTELLTHRRNSRNAASNRAMSVAANIDELSYYVPDKFFKNKKGMSVGEEVDQETADLARVIYEQVWKNSCSAARMLSSLGISKSQANRVLPAFKNIKGLVTATYSAWEYFFSLRSASDADPAMQELSNLIKLEWEKEPVEGTVHYPYLKYPTELSSCSPEEATNLLGGRCAAISHNKEIGDLNAIRLGERLREQKHLSPFEHLAKWCMYPKISNFTCRETDTYVTEELQTLGWEQYR